MDLLITVKDRTFVIPDWVTALIVVGLVALSSVWGDTEKINDPHLLMCDALSAEESGSEFVAEEQSMSMMDDVQVDEKCFIYDDEDDNDDHHHEEEDDNNEGGGYEEPDQYQV